MAIGDYPIDPNTPRRRGPPLEGDPRRCQSKRRRHDEQCKRWAAIGESYCKFHLGHTARTKRTTQMKGFYGKIAKGRLLQWMEEAANDDERASLIGEVDAARALAAEAVGIVSAVMDAKTEVDEVAKITAMSLARDSLEHVSRLVERMVKTDLVSKATLDVNQVNDLLTKISSMIAGTLRDFAVDDAEAIHNEIMTRINEAKLAARDRTTAAQVNIDLSV